MSAPAANQHYKAPTGTHPLAPNPAEETPQPAEAPAAPKPTVMVSARISVDLRQAVRSFGAERGVSVQEIMPEALTEYLDRNSWQPPTRQHVNT